MSVHNDLDSSTHGGPPMIDLGGGVGVGGGGGGGGNLDDSVHGLRSANSTLTSKMADMEANYLNQITALSNQVKTLTEKCRLKDQQLEALESSAAAAEKDMELFEMSKHTIADLKSQLYTLQDQVEDAELDRQGDIDHLTKESEEAQRQLREEIASLEAEVEEYKASAVAAASNGSAAADGSSRSVGGNVANADVKAYEDEIAMLKTQLSEAKPVWGQIDSLRREKDREIAELRSILRGRDDNITTLQGKNAALLEEKKSLGSELDGLRSEVAATSQEREEELVQLRDAVGKRDDDIKAARTELKEQVDLAARLTTEIADLKEVNEALETAGSREESETASMIAKLQEQLKEAESTIASLKEEVADSKRQVTKLEQARDDAEANLDGVKKELEEAREACSEREAATEETALLRKEVDDVTRERVALEDELTEKLASLEKEKFQAVNELEIRLQEKDEQVEALNAKVDDKAKAESNEVAEVRAQLLEAQQALVALDNEKHGSLKDEASELQKVQNELVERERDFQLAKKAMSSLDTSLKDREAELETARARIDTLEAAVEELENGVIKPMARGVEDAPDDEGGSAGSRIKALEAERAAVESELKAKLEDRETTISALIKSSTRAEHNLNKLKAEVASLQEQVGEGGGNVKAVARGASVERDLQSMREKLDGYKRVEDQLSKEVSMLKQELSQARAEVKRLKSDSAFSSEVEETEKKLAAIEERKQEMEDEHREQILERDAAINKLVKSSVSLEQHISGLQEEVERLRKNKGGSSKKAEDGPSWEELHRLQQESEIFAGQIIEQDEEIEGLRNELDEQRDINLSLSEQVSDLKSNGHAAARGGADEAKLANMQAHLDEVQEANKAHREELRELRIRLRETQLEADRVADLEVQLREAQSAASSTVQTRSFQGDEMEEFDLREQLEHVQRSKASIEAELRQARRDAADAADKSAAIVAELRQVKRAAADQPKSLQVEEELRQDLEDAIATKEASEQRMMKQIESLRKLKDSAKHEFEEQIRERDEEITSLKESAAKQSELVVSLQKEIDGFESAIKKEDDQAVTSLRTEIDGLKSSLDEKSELIKQLEKETDMLKTSLEEQKILAAKERRNAEVEFSEDVKVATLDKDGLVNRVYELEGELKSLEKDYSNIRDLRKRLKLAEEDRSKVEQKVAAAFEKKIILLQTEKDAEIDRLRKDLTFSKEKLIELESERSALLRKLDSSNIEIQEELEERLHEKNARIMALEQTLSAQEQVLGNMQAEMDQLQSGMDKVSLTRRAEIEEMEQELMESAQAVTKYEREIVVLKDKLEDVGLRHSDEVDRLKQRINQLESETPFERSVREQRDDHKVQELNEKIDQLKWRLSDLQEDNQRLRDKIEQQSSASHKRTSSSTDRYRTAALQEQVHKLSQKNKDLEKELTVTASSTNYGLSTIDNSADTPIGTVTDEDEAVSSPDSSNYDSPARSLSSTVNSDQPPKSASKFGKSAKVSTPSKFDRAKAAGSSPTKLRSALGGVGAPFHRKKASKDASSSKSLKSHFSSGRSKSRSRATNRADDSHATTNTEDTS